MGCYTILAARLSHFFLVPVYDGRESLSLANYWVKKYEGTVEPGTTVCLLFSIKRGTLPPDAQSFKISDSMVAVYLNILGVIVLAEPSDDFCLDGSPEPMEVHGIDALPKLTENEKERIIENGEEGGEVEVF